MERYKVGLFDLNITLNISPVYLKNPNQNIESIVVNLIRKVIEILRSHSKAVFILPNLITASLLQTPSTNPLSNACEFFNTSLKIKITVVLNCSSPINPSPANQNFQLPIDQFVKWVLKITSDNTNQGFSYTVDFEI